MTQSAETWRNRDPLNTGEEIRLPNSHVSRLPDEVLLHIFLLYQDASYGERKEVLDVMEYNHLAPWMRITLVCYHWRKLVLEDPRLWKYVRIDLFHDIEPSLRVHSERSKRVLLDLDVSLHGESEDDSTYEQLQAKQTCLLQSAAHLFERCESLTIREAAPGVFVEFFNRLPMPHLHTLCIVGVSRRPYNCTGYHDSNRTRRDQVVLRDHSITCPSLRRLYVSEWAVNWDSQLLHGLTHVRLCDLMIQISVKGFLNILENMPLLEWLDIYYAFDTPRMINNVYQGCVYLTHPLNMPALRFLRVCDYTFQTSQFLSNIALNPSFKIEINAHYGGNSDLGTNERLQGKFETLRLHRYKDGSHSIVGFYSHIPNLEELMQHDGDLTWLEDRIWKSWMEGSQSSGPPISVEALIQSCLFNQKCSTVPMNHLTMLSISGTFEFSVPVWVYLFGWLPCLQEIFVGTTDTLDFFRALGWGMMIEPRMKGAPRVPKEIDIPWLADVDPSDLPTGVPFPALRRIHAHAVHGGLWNDVYTLIRKILRLRKMKGYPVSYVRFLGHKFGKDRSGWEAEVEKFVEVLGGSDKCSFEFVGTSIRFPPDKS